MEASVTRDLIQYVNSNALDWQELAPGAHQKVLFHNPDTGERSLLIRFDPGYEAKPAPDHAYGEYIYVLDGTFVDHNQASGPGTYLHHLPGSNHQPKTPDGCLLFVYQTPRQSS